MKKQVIAVLAVAAMLGLTACGESEKNDNKVDNAIDVTVSEDALKDDATKEAAIEAETEVVTEVETVAVPTELSDKYADLDNRSFKYNGHLYTLGVSTLQDFLDNGVEFTSSDNWDKMWSDDFYGRYPQGSFECDVEVGSSRGNHLTLSFIKRDISIPMRECILGKVWYTGYDDEKASDFYTQPEFAFPRTMKPDELIANSGEPTYIEESGITDKYYNYTVVSDKFNTEDSGYEFYYTGEDIRYVVMSWIP